MSVQRRFILPVVLLVSLMAAPAAASAKVSISLSDGVIYVNGDDADNVVFETGFDETTPWFTTPAPGTLTAGNGCNQLSPTGVECPGTTAPTRATVDLGAGDDLFLWSGTSVPMTISGGPGDDEISGGQGPDTLRGGAGDDILVGFGGNDRIDGNDGLDVIDGSSGDDRIDGGNGIDKLNGDGEGDADTAAKPFGDDTIISRDGFADEVECEGGIDTVTADRLDRVATSCESVAYTESAGSGSSGSGNPVGPLRINPPQVIARSPGLTLKVKRGKLPKLRSFAKGSRIRLSLKATESCKANVTMTVSKTQARKLKFRRSRTLARAKGSVSSTKSKTIRVRGSKTFRKAVKKKRSALMSIRVSCKPAAGKSATAKLAIRLKR